MSDALTHFVLDTDQQTSLHGGVIMDVKIKF